MDAAARALLERVYRARGGWASTRLADPPVSRVAWWRLWWGIDVLEAEPRTGGLRVPNRWCRAFTRAVYYQHKWYSGDPNTGGWRTTRRTTWNPRPLQIEFGRHRTILGVIPAGYVVRARLRAGGKTARNAVAKLPENRQWADGGALHSDSDERDWAPFG